MLWNQIELFVRCRSSKKTFSIKAYKLNLKNWSTFLWKITTSSIIMSRSNSSKFMNNASWWKRIWTNTRNFHSDLSLNLFSAFTAIFRSFTLSDESWESRLNKMISLKNFLLMMINSKINQLMRFSLERLSVHCLNSSQLTFSMLTFCRFEKWFAS